MTRYVCARCDLSSITLTPYRQRMRIRKLRRRRPLARSVVALPKTTTPKMRTKPQLSPRRKLAARRPLPQTKMRTRNPRPSLPKSRVARRLPPPLKTPTKRRPRRSPPRRVVARRPPPKTPTRNPHLPRSRSRKDAPRRPLLSRPRSTRKRLMSRNLPPRKAVVRGLLSLLIRWLVTNRKRRSRLRRRGRVVGSPRRPLSRTSRLLGRDGAAAS